MVGAGLLIVGVASTVAAVAPIADASWHRLNAS